MSKHKNFKLSWCVPVQNLYVSFHYAHGKSSYKIPFILKIWGFIDFFLLIGVMANNII